MSLNKSCPLKIILLKLFTFKTHQITLRDSYFLFHDSETLGLSTQPKTWLVYVTSHICVKNKTLSIIQLYVNAQMPWNDPPMCLAHLKCQIVMLSGH